MTSPITFDPLPVPDFEALANIPPWAAGQGAVLDTNFDRVNSYLTALGKRGYAASYAQGAAIINPGNTGGAWTTFAANVFAPQTFKVPVCEALVVSVNARVYVPGYMWAAVRAWPSGPGFSGGSITNLEASSQGSVVGLGRWMSTGTTFYMQASWGLRFGENITFTPQWSSSYHQFEINSGYMSFAAVG